MPASNPPLKDEWFSALAQTHNTLIRCVDKLSDDALLYREPGKWNAGQQLQHVYLCLSTISQALGSKEYITNNFGSIDRSTWSYDEVIARYKAGLAAGGKAPERFVPSEFEPGQKQQVIDSLRQLIEKIRSQLQSYTDEECDTLVLPHPFVGKLTIRELFFLMTEHALIHQASIDKALEAAGMH